MESIYARYPSLRERVVVVTGGASGIGAAIVEAFAEQGAHVAFLDVQQNAAGAFVEQLRDRYSASVHFRRCDLTDVGAITAAMNSVERELGPVSVLVNNAGNDTRHAIEDVTPELWDRILAVNLKHQFFTTQAVLPGMRKRASGSIINMSSIGWIIPSVKLPVYVTAKAAIVGMTRTLAHELGPDNIRVNCVLPGAILTERQQQLWFTPEYKEEILRNQALKRILGPEEVARLVLFLAADDSSAITSQSYVIDGGWV